MTAAWWSTFFTGAALRLWRQAIPPEVTRLETEFIVRELGLVPGQQVLDVPCGNGRLALELAARGMEVTGVDLCRPFIDEAGEAARERGVDARFELREMRDLPWSETFDAAICFGNSFGYLSGDENADFLRALGATLGSGGGFLLQTAAAAESVLADFTETDRHEAGDLTLHSTSTYDPLRAALRVDYAFHEKGSGAPTERKTAEYRIYTVRQICEMLRDAGFAEIRIQGDMDGSPFAIGSRFLYLLARKA